LFRYLQERTMSASLTQPPLSGLLTPNPKAEAPQAQRSKQGSSFSLGKYREIIIAVALFLLFDLGVLVLNFYTSYQIAEDAVGINLAGRQRMLSQRTAKSLLALESAQAHNLPVATDLEELRKAVKLFDASLKGFQGGATVPGGDGKPVFLHAAQSPQALEILRKAQLIWTPYQERLAPVLAGQASDAELRDAVQYARSNNLPLLALMNELTTALEAVASDRANTLRLVQTGGIALALLNFVFILFKFLRRLRSSDAAIEAANEENREILTSVREGLFLLTPDFQLGSQLSQSAHQLFGRNLTPGDDFFALLQPLVTPKVLQDGRDYVELLFSPHIKESLVQNINPLVEVRVLVKNRLGVDESRYLSFQFNRVQENKVVRHLLVTVQDITARIDLEQRLHTERQRSEKEFGMLLKAVEADPLLLKQFVDRTEANLLAINDLLRDTARAQGDAGITDTLNAVGRLMHTVKGDAATMGLDTLASQAHAFETELQRIRHGEAGSNMGDALLALPMPLEDLLHKIGSLKALTGAARTSESLPVATSPNEALSRLAGQIAQEQGTQVATMVRLGAVEQLDNAAAQNLVHDIVVQLVRNAVVHGIEAPATRLSTGKPPEGRVEAELLREGAEWVLCVRDDGAGLDANVIRQKLLDMGWYNPPQLASFDDRQILMHIFKPGFSTAGQLNEHAGRGVGLDVVQAQVQKLGARLMLRSTPGKFTEFIVRFAA
jgi:HPt (histidine-containing phosphotransfer) domain-containing protein